MKNFKTLFFIVIITLISSNSYAFENVIGISGGIQTIFPSSIKQTILSKNINDEMHPYYNHNEFLLSSFGFNQDIEYQARFTKSILGLIFSNNNYTYHTRYYNQNLTLTSQSNDLSVEYLVDLKQYKRLSFYIGPSLGLSYFNINEQDSSNLLYDGNKTKQVYILVKIILDSEYKVNNHFSIFSKLNLNFPFLDNIYYKTNYYDSNQVTHYPIIRNNLRIGGFDLSSINLSFGIRYFI